MSSKVVDIQSELNGIIEKLLCNGMNKSTVQDKYILPPNERPHMPEVSCYSEKIPVVDLKDLDGPKRSRVVEEIRIACEEDGFFQIVNHGVSESVMKSMMGIAKEFFEMPVEDRAYLYSEDPMQRVRLSPSFNIGKEKVLNWRDYLLHPCHPLEEVIRSWPEKPAAYSQDMTVNYYPPCPNPEITMGLAGHSDASGITVVMQGDVNGLQVLKNGKWVSVGPIANAFVINLGDQLQVLSNGKFRSVEHRAVTNASTARISISMFYSPSMDALIAPAASLIDEQYPALYRGYQFGEFMRVFWGQELKGKKVLDHFKIEHPTGK